MSQEDSSNSTQQDVPEIVKSAVLVESAPLPEGTLTVRGLLKIITEATDNCFHSN